MATLLADGVKVSWPMKPYESRSSPSVPTPRPLTAPLPPPTPLNCSVVPMPLPQYPEPVREKDVLPKRSPPPAPTAVLDASNVGPGAVDLAFCAVPLAHSITLPLFQLTSVSTRGT